MSESRNSSVRIGSGSVTVGVGALDADQRLDRFLRKLVPGASLSFLFKAIDRGRIRLNGEKAAPGIRIRAGDRITIPMGRDEWERLAHRVDSGRPDRPGAAPAVRLRVVHDDDWLLAVDKPSGQTTHGGPHSLTQLVSRRLERAAAGALTFRAAPAHRLDKDTSGLVVFGKTPAAQRALAAAFRERVASKHYVALVAGKPPASGVLRGRLVRRDRARGPKVAAGAAGAHAETRYRRRATNGEVSLLELRPLTGRTHQLRAQLADLGHPILGDRRYGTAAARALARSVGLGRLFLHAARLELPHPAGGARLVLTAALPPELDRILGKLELIRPGA